MARLFAGGACALSLPEYSSSLATSIARLFFELALALNFLEGAVSFVSPSTSEVMGVSAPVTKDSGLELKFGDALDVGVAVSDDLETSLEDRRVTLAMARSLSATFKMSLKGSALS
jgi:hypothetical protein